MDDLKPTLGCYGDSYAVTPSIDALAKRGVRFDAAYCNQAVCAPSRNSLMTGVRPQSIGVYDLRTHFRKAAPDLVTVTQHFMSHGYHAEGLGKIFHTGHGNKDDAYADGQIALEAIDRLKRLAVADQPFFLAVGFVKPHLPFIAPRKYWELYDPDDVPMPEFVERPRDAPEYAPTSGGELVSYSDIDSIKGLSESQVRRLIHGYYAATSYMDAQLGRVIDQLDQLGLADDTIVVLWGDHGWHLGDHGMWCKHTNYEQAVRIPLIVVDPNGAKDAATNALVETVDIYPTLSDLAGLSPPRGLDGKSFAATVGKPTEPARPFITHVYPRSQRLGRAVRDPRYRLVEWRPTQDGVNEADLELYDYQNDPLETANIADQHPEVVARLLGFLQQQSPAKSQWRN